MKINEECEITKEEVFNFAKYFTESAFRIDINCGIYLQQVGSSLWSEAYPKELAGYKNFLTVMGFSHAVLRFGLKKLDAVCRQHKNKKLVVSGNEKGPDFQGETATEYQETFLKKNEDKFDMFLSFTPAVKFDEVKAGIFNLTMPIGASIEDDMALVREGTYDENIPWLIVKLAQARGLLLCPGAINFMYQGEGDSPELILLGLMLIQKLEKHKIFQSHATYNPTNYYFQQKSLFVSRLREYYIRLYQKSCAASYLFNALAGRYGVDAYQWSLWTEDGRGYLDEKKKEPNEDEDM